MVPNHGGGTEAQRPASLLQPPAHVHVVSGDAEPWVEPADRLETRFTERHVAAGDVLRLAIGEEDVHRPARRARHALGDPLRVHTTTDTRGQGRLGANGTSAKASRTARSAGLGLRSRRVTPKSQSSTSSPERCHSSVQAYTNAPAHPAANALRTCQSRVRACKCSPWRRLSSPISLITTGRSPARVCRRARYA